MAYSDGLNVEMAALVQGETGAADILDIYFPAGGQVEAFGSLTEEAWDVAGAANVLSLDVSSDSAEGDRAEVATLTHPKTAALGPVGAVFHSTSSLLPKRVVAGGHATLEVKTAAADSGGAFRAFAIVRYDGLPSKNAYPTAASLGIAV